jgi:hypothetical protein
VFHVFAYGADGDEEDVGDFGVAVAGGGQLQDLVFAAAEVGDVAAAAFGVEVDLVQVRPGRTCRISRSRSVKSRPGPRQKYTFRVRPGRVGSGTYMQCVAPALK